MPAPKGNQFWKERAKHGRDTLFATPELLWDAACEYFTKTDERKWIKEDWVGKNAKKVERKTETPYTLSGLCLYIRCNKHYFNDFKTNCSEGFSEVIARIEEIIQTQQIEGALVGAFNSNIVARLNSLSENIKTKDETPIINNFDNLTDDELFSLAKTIDKLKDEHQSE